MIFPRSRLSLFYKNHSGPFSLNLRPKMSLFLESFSILLFIVVSIRWWIYVNRYSVNILFWDQWDIYGAFFDKHNLWEIFSWQNGPHRQGAGSIITGIIANLSGWNTRTECFIIGGTVFLAMFCAILLKRRLTSALSWADVSIALIFLAPIQYEIFTMIPNLSHGPMPLLLLILYALSWTIPHTAIRYALVLTLNFLLTFTGFGIVICVITPLLFIINGICAYREKDTGELVSSLVCIIICLMTIAAFFIGYKFEPAVPNFVFPADRFWIEYPRFVCLLLAYFFQIKINSAIPALWLGLIIAFLLVSICLFHLRRLFKASSGSGLQTRNAWLSRSIVILSSFTLAFSVLAAIGRVSTGPYVSRYIPYLVPGFFAVYLHILDIAGKTRLRINKDLILAVVVSVFFVGCYPLNEWDRHTFEWFMLKKSMWKDRYLISENIEATDKAVGLVMHPNAGKTHLKDKLDYLKRRKLNLYL